jgi:hypothetical protein
MLPGEKAGRRAIHLLIQGILYDNIHLNKALSSSGAPANPCIPTVAADGNPTFRP